MNLLQLEYFIQVAHTENISAAAKNLFISQPTLSRSIAELEKEIGSPLFDRANGRIHLNQRGQIFLEHAEQSFAELNGGLTAVRDLCRREFGSISIASVYSISFLPELIRNFYTQNPDIKVNYQLCNGREAANKTLEYEADFAVVTKELDDDRFETVLLNQEPVCALIGGANPLSRRERISLRELENEKFLCNPFATSRRMTTDICKSAGFTPEISMECNNQPLNELILERLPLVYLLPQNDAEARAAHFRYSFSRVVPLEEKITFPVILCRRKKHHMSAAAEEFYRYVIEYAQRGFHNT